MSEQDQKSYAKTVTFDAVVVKSTMDYRLLSLRVFDDDLDRISARKFKSVLSDAIRKIGMDVGDEITITIGRKGK